VRNGSRYIIVDGDRIYELAGNLGQLGQFAGQRVTLIGVLNGNTIKVSSEPPSRQVDEQGVVAIHSQATLRYPLHDSLRANFHAALAHRVCRLPANSLPESEVPPSHSRGIRLATSSNYYF
jgi:hypothetical protein